jgi:hypothetical protein
MHDSRKYKTMDLKLVVRACTVDVGVGDLTKTLYNETSIIWPIEISSFKTSCESSVTQSSIFIRDAFSRKENKTRVYIL